jgi:transcriptional regulator with XRE-family HTH domain
MTKIADNKAAGKEAGAVKSKTAKSSAPPQKSRRRIKGLETHTLTVWSKRELTLTDVCVRGTGERLAYLRSVVGMTLNQAAESSQISRAELSRLENGDRKLTEAHLVRLAKIFRLPLQELKDILDYKIDTRVQILASEAASAASTTCQLKSFPVSQMPSKNRHHTTSDRKISVHFESALSKHAYVIELDKMDDPLLPPQALVIVDPDRLVRLGELVLNTVSNDPPLVRLYRSRDGALYGCYGDVEVEFTKAVGLKNFHKIMAILPAPEEATSPTILKSKELLS